MKKLLAGLLSLCMVFGLIIMPVSAETEGYYTYTVLDGNVWINSCDISVSGDITIPSSLGGYPVTGISWHAFRYCKNLTSINIPESVTSIGSNAFEGCTSLTSISLPKSIMLIDAYTFSGCTSLKDIDLPESLINIYACAFEGCTSLISISLPESITLVANNAFYGCTSLISINVDEGNGRYSSQEGVLFNKDKTFLLGCPGGKEGAYRIPEGVTNIGGSAFSCCESLTSISIPDSVTSIGMYAFEGCTSLKCINIPESVTSIDSSAFSDCTSLTSINIPESVTSISYGVFDGCTSLTSISVPKGVTSIGLVMFKDCTSLTSISLPESLTSVGSSAFEGCASLTDIYYTGTEDQWKGIDIARWNEYLTNATIHYNYTFPEIILEPIADDITIDKTISKNGRITATIASESRDMSDIQMFVSTHKDGLMTNASEAAKEVADGKVTFTSAMPFANGRIFIWDSNQRPLTKVSEIE